MEESSFLFLWSWVVDFLLISICYESCKSETYVDYCDALFGVCFGVSNVDMNENEYC